MDINVQAFRLVQQAIESSSAEAAKKRSALRKGGRIGGNARASILSADRRREIALAGSAARWGHNNPAAHTQEEKG